MVCTLGILAFSLTGCSNNDTFTEKRYLSGENKIEKVTIQVENRELEITESDDFQIHIDYFDSEKEYLDISISENNELIVKLLYDKNWTDYIGTKQPNEYRKINIKIPNNLINTLSATTTNNNLTLNSISCTKEINLDVNGGNIECRKVNVGKSINLKAKNGNITGSILGSYDDFSILCKIKKGSCNLPLNKIDGTKSLIADCNNGDIKLEFIKYK